jgi:pyruvate/2-oxoglutarate/acetoin dehydrogenase E1 component
MGRLAQHPQTLFVGQSVAYDGQRGFATFEQVPMERRIEMPICEDFTVGFCTGLSLEGYIPVCFIPRWDFLLLAANQLVNHLDKMPKQGKFRPKVILRTAVGTDKPLNPGHQHTQDHSEAFARMLHTVRVFHVKREEDVEPSYNIAMNMSGSCIIVEHMSEYK